MRSRFRPHPVSHLHHGKPAKTPLAITIVSCREVSIDHVVKLGKFAGYHESAVNSTIVEFVRVVTIRNFGDTLIAHKGIEVLRKLTLVSIKVLRRDFDFDG